MISKEEAIYVGESSQILSRIAKHIRSGGDFVKARSMERSVVTEVINISPDLTEKELYKEMVERHGEENVFGGR